MVVGVIKSSPSLRSIAIFDRTGGHIGNEKPQIAYAISSQES